MDRLSHPSLTPRQNEMLGHLSIGAGTGDIVRAMGIAPTSVQRYVRVIADRLGVPGEMRRRGLRIVIVRIAAHEAALAAAREAIEQLTAA